MLRSYNITKFSSDTMRLDRITESLSLEEGRDILFSQFGNKIIDISEDMYTEPLLKEGNVNGFFLDEEDVLFIGGWFEYVVQDDNSLYFLIHNSLLEPRIYPKFIEIGDRMCALN